MSIIAEVSEPLTAQDRCDKCGAQAKVRAVLVSGELYFCAHHAKEIGYTLLLKSVRVYDPEGVFTNG